jgi:mono/diheme cytochrome c family protein
MHRAGIPGRVRFQIWILVGLFLALGSSGLAQDKQVKEQPIEHREALSGAGMFKDYCAVCHGKDAKGDGPAVSALKQAPANLTTLARNASAKLSPNNILFTIHPQILFAVHVARSLSGQKS